MPRLVGALLCGTLIWIYPDMLKIVFAHAEKTEKFIMAYVTLGGATIILAGLIAFYIWLGFKSGPSGLEYALRQFSKIFGQNREEEREQKSNRDGKNSLLSEKGQAE